ncbi:NADH dehydrogenase [ubiquinone] 1 beta subcomplex subunit 2, mitochondrial-like [Aricia agestis]|uniref:NADH dehydrogenase [ubiquinone] 1 beta subcomplex subunit 2, mitochondrial-like n=1 Tax=Aricia agestis TaxID=91739 RepID=UPI001C208BF9|nr:NADH dehydrogenase [ubiquinone] 1 beta subcomplex subunit 2, mitochondrial-like [Aricia agestis]
MLTRTALSRALLLRSFKNAANNLKQTKRNSGHGSWAYRVPPAMPSKRETYLAQGFGAFAWWWIMWHILTEPEHIFGEWTYIPPKTWTNEELGIPPDSEGPLKN